MFKRIITILIITIIIGCKTQKDVVRTTTNDLPKKQTVKVVKKPIKVVQDVVITRTEPVKTAPEAAKTNNNQEVLEATSKVKVTSKMVTDYIEKYKPIAKKSMKKFGVPASITLAQALLESGSGVGNLCLQANNHFGIKCRNDWTGPSVKYDDDAAQECFRKYSNPEDSFKDHSSFLLSKPWYSKLFLLDKKDYKSWARGLKSAGYATDPQYPQKLITLIEKYKLYEIDNEVVSNSSEIIENKNSETTIIEQNIEESSYTVLRKDTLYSVSKKFNLSIEDLKKINKLSDNNLSIGQSLKIR